LKLEKEYSCQLEIDHVTQQPKQTCQTTHVEDLLYMKPDFNPRPVFSCFGPLCSGDSKKYFHQHVPRNIPGQWLYKKKCLPCTQWAPEWRKEKPVKSRQIMSIVAFYKIWYDLTGLNKNSVQTVYVWGELRKLYDESINNRCSKNM
jgi:hypothetical protein